MNPRNDGTNLPDCKAQQTKTPQHDESAVVLFFKLEVKQFVAVWSTQS